MTVKANLTYRDVENRERNFLKACGFNLEYGYWSEDVERLKAGNPELFHRIVVCGESR